MAVLGGVTFGPLQFFAHDGDDVGEGFLGRLDVQEGEAKASGDHVDGCHRVLADAVADFGVDVGKLGEDFFADDGPPFA